MRGTFIHFGALALAAGCRNPYATLIVSEGDTFAEMRTIKGDVSVTPPGEAARPPYPRERIVDREEVRLGAGGLAWIRRDAGAVWLVEGPAQVTLHDSSVVLSEGRAFVDSEGGPPASIDTPRGPIELSDARASIAILADGTEEVYVLRGSARAGSIGRGEAGELLTLKTNGSAARSPAVAWEDWTGGLATADPAAEPAPFGIGTVGARPPGDKGKPRFSLVIERLDVRVNVDHDFAVTEVDETFANVSSETVEGIFSFRTPSDAVLHRFGVDRNGDLVWGQIKESAAAQAQYESNVYAGSTEDPALLQWVAPGVYSARLYPIGAGAKRRVVTRYAEWLPRQGPRADRRLYVYPMAAEGARGSLPRIEEFHVAFDLSRAGADRVRAGMGGKRDGDQVVFRAFDFVPRADLAVELFDRGQNDFVGYRAPHTLTAEDIPVNAGADFANKVSSEERDYLLVPVRARASGQERKGVDLAIIVDTSAATDVGALAIARSLSSAMLAHLGPDDRAALWAGDARLRSVVEGSGELTALDPGKRRAWLEGLARVEPGGATDIGALLTEAAGRLDPKRRGAVVYIGDGQPSVGEIAPKALRERLARLPQGTRVLAAGVGVRANLSLLQSVARGAPVEPVGDAYGAARAALRLLEAAQRPGLVGATVDLGPGVERVLPREMPAVGEDEGVLVVGRLSGKLPTQLTLAGGGDTETVPLRIGPIQDSGDLRRRWGLGRLQELLDEGAGRAALVDIGRRFGVVTPYTSLYVPTEREAAKTDDVARESLADLRAKAIECRAWWRPWSNTGRGALYGGVRASPPAALEVDEKAGGTGTRAKGEEGAMGSPMVTESGRAYGVTPGQGAAAPKAAMAAPPPATAKVGMLALLSAKAGTPSEPAPPSALDLPASPSRDVTPLPAGPQNAERSSAGAVGGDAFGAGGLAASGTGVGGGGQGIGGGRGKLAAGHGAPAPKLREGAVTINGSPAAEATQRLAPQKPSPLQVTAAPSPLAIVGHIPRPCGAASDLSLDDRRALWSERLAVTVSANDIVVVYHRALEDCEAPTWQERTQLLRLAVDRLRTVTERVALWKKLIGTPAADVVYRAIVVRVQTVADLRELHQALGLATVDPDLLAGMIAKGKTPADRLSILRAAALKWPDDLELALRVLDGYEDAGDENAGRAWARRLRRRPDSTAHVWTSVGEYYLRLGAREKGPASERDSLEGRRTFGELVEFAPEDPAARRRLGDLLRAHAWYEEAFRQYETLELLTPDDPAVPLLLAAAAQGMGRVEEAVGWAEKAAGAGSPDGASELSRSARASARAFLAWARADALQSGRKDDADKLLARTRRLEGTDAAGQGGSVRFLVTWSHPELRPSLWTTALGGPTPAPDNFPFYGVAEARVDESSAAPEIELHLDPDDAERAARLGARAMVTAITGEGTADERVARLDVGFGSVSSPANRVKVDFDHGALRIDEGGASRPPSSSPVEAP